MAFVRIAGFDNSQGVPGPPIVEIGAVLFRFQIVVDRPSQGSVEIVFGPCAERPPPPAVETRECRAGDEKAAEDFRHDFYEPASSERHIER